MVLDFALIQNNIIGQFILPFALFFAIVYGSLRTANVFSEKNVNLIIAAVIGFIASLSSPLVSALFDFMPFIFGLLALLFVYNLIYTLLGGKKGEQKKEPSGDVLFVTGAILIIVAISGRSFIPDIGIMDQTNLIFLIALLAVFVVWKRGWEPE